MKSISRHQLIASIVVVILLVVCFLVTPSRVLDVVHGEIIHVGNLKILREGVVRPICEYDGRRWVLGLVPMSLGGCDDGNSNALLFVMQVEENKRVEVLRLSEERSRLVSQRIASGLTAEKRPEWSLVVLGRSKLLRVSYDELSSEICYYSLSGVEVCGHGFDPAYLLSEYEDKGSE